MLLFIVTQILITFLHSKDVSLKGFLCKRRPSRLNLRVCERLRPRPLFLGVEPNHANRWSCVIAFQNEGSTEYIFPLRLEVLQWSRHLFNYWKNKKIIIEKFFILLI